MGFINEHTLIGHLGHFFIIVAFVSSLTVIYSYCLGCIRSGEQSDSWRQFSRWIFAVHSIAVVVVVGMLFFIIASHYFEFHYVWKYSSLSMQARYIFSCFWSGQEGSLLLWSFWIMVLSWIVIKTSGEWEAYVMPFVSVVQAFIFSMLLGVYIGDVKIGSNPFILIRELPENASMPWAHMEDYLLQITSFQDGVGLNPLLQNYWMTIHPPVLFLGFAATLFPFAFALAGQIRKLHSEWVRPALPWGVFGLMVLGAGILLGGAWAYESLSFGGFWAWDPVENASLVPWLLLVGGVHCMQITSKRGRGGYLSVLFCTAPFLLVLYSSFLTRSGVLGESSVHSFTENGLSLHLLIFLLTGVAGTVFVVLQSKKLRMYFCAISLAALLIYLFSGSLLYSLPLWLVAMLAIILVNYEKHFPKGDGEIDRSSREFWMFAGAILILISAIQITISTSIPVINLVFNTRLDAFTDLPSRNAFYNTWQIPVAVLITILIGISQFLTYRKTDGAKILRQLRRGSGVSLLIIVVAMAAFRYSPISEWQYTLLLISAVFAIVLNAEFMRKVWRRRVDGAGSSLAHIGFALLLLGALISGSRKTIISDNKASFSLEELNKDFRNNENVLLKYGDTVLMNNYFVSYRGRYKEGPNMKYKINYYEAAPNGHNILQPGDSLFSLYPIVQLNEQFGNVAEPGTKHFLTHDVFTHIKYADMDVKHLPEGYNSDGFMGETTFKVSLGSEISIENYRFLLEDIYLLDAPAEKEKLGFNAGDVVVKAVMKVRNTDIKQAEAFYVEPLFIVRDSATVIPHELYSRDLDARIRIAELAEEKNTMVLGLRQREFVVMQAYVFPAMNILWAGCVLMILGCFVSLRKYWAGKPAKVRMVPGSEPAIPYTERR